MIPLSCTRIQKFVIIYLTNSHADGELKEWITLNTQSILAHSNFEFGKNKLKKLIEKYQHF